MNSDLLRDAHAVFLPAFDNWDIGAVLTPFLANGGCSLLIGESRVEYLARRMSDERRLTESAAFFQDRLDRLTGGMSGIIIAVDEELAGIRRLEGLVPDLPTLEEARAMADREIEERCYENARAARALGITMYLAPIMDVVTGGNPWLKGRTISPIPAEVTRIGSAFIRGVQRAGITAVAKHFPGYDRLDADPAITDVSLATPLDRVMENARAFSAAIASGTAAVMVGPAPICAVDRENAACVSPAVIGLLRTSFGFSGLIVSDDLDAPATMRGRSLLDTALAGLTAGADLLLVAGGPHLSSLCHAVAQAAEDGRLPPERLREAAKRVRAVAAR